jgi:hypothetical protein
VSVLVRALVCVLLATSLARADGTTRVLLADNDPELQRAVIATLAPWRLQVVVDTERPVDTTHAQMIGDAQTARFVVWRENGDLVVYDRERREAEHRVAPSGPLDPASAAAAALTVKTLMRLPPPDQVATAAPVAEPVDRVALPAPRPDEPASLRIQAGLATRAARGLDNQFGARTNLAVFVKPTSFALRFGVGGEIGTASDVQGTGFKGTWRDWSVIGLASYAIDLAPRWEIEPYVGAGALRSELDGVEGIVQRHKRETLVTMRGGTFVRVRTGRFSAGAVLAFDATLGTPTYTRAGGGSQFFEVPPFALSIGVIIAADLTR